MVILENLIKVRGRRLLLNFDNSNNNIVGNFGDNKVEIKQFEITEERLFNYSFKLDVDNGVERFTIDLDKTVHEDKIILTWEVLRNHITPSVNTKSTNMDIRLKIKLRALSDNDEVWNSNIGAVSVRSGFNATDDIPTPTPSEFEIMEQRISSMKQDVLTAKNTTIVKANEVFDNADVVTQKASEVSLNTQQVVSFKEDIIRYKDEIESNKQIVDDKTLVVVDKEQIVTEKTDIVQTLAQEVSDNTSQVASDRLVVDFNTQEVANNLETVLEKTAEALQSAANALVSEQNAHTSAGNAEVSNQSALTAMQTAVQAMTDLLAMMGEDIATLTNGKLTPSQIPPLSINDVFEVDSIEEMLQLTAERGDVALVLLDENIHDSYMLSTDEPSNLDDWKKLGVSYVANAGHSLTADNAENANKINNKRLVSMTESQYDVAVKEENTFYAVVPD